jgi:hypothetical protein
MLLFKFTLYLNSVLPFWKLLVFDYLLGISHCMLAVLLKAVLVLDAHQLLMLSTHIQTKMFLEALF